MAASGGPWHLYACRGGLVIAQMVRNDHVVRRYTTLCDRLKAAVLL